MSAHIEPKETVVRRLFKRGFLGEFPTVEAAIHIMSDDDVASAVSLYQRWHGLEADGVVGPETKRSMSAQRICALPDYMPMGEELNAWPDPRIRWHVLNPGKFPGLDEAKVLEAFTWAWAQWKGVCGVLPEFTPRAEQAHVVIECGSIDRPGGTLAWSELADGSMRVKRQKYDSQENWLFQQGAQLPRFRIDLGRTSCHEIGHVLGLPHIASGNLLQPMYDLNIWTPQAGDIREVVARYGPPKNTTPPPPPPTGKRWTITLTGEGDITDVQVPGFRITKVQQAA
jgi:hypothetical protein